MAKAVAFFQGGVTDLREVAVREDGVVFRRLQDKDPRWGYKWGKWTPTGEVFGANAMANMTSVKCGFATLFRATPQRDGWAFKPNGDLKFRLPN